jgi:hypothetical protein
VQYSTIENAVISKPHYFPEDTYLPEFDYTVSAGSTLMVAENRNGNQRLTINADYSVRSTKLKSNIKVALFYDYTRFPGYAGERPVMQTWNACSATLGISCNFSSAFIPFFSSVTSYGDRYGGVTHNKYLNQTFEFGARSLIAGHFELNCSNKLYRSIRWPEVSGTDDFGLISNLSLGYRFGAKKNFIVRLEGNDLFDKERRITATTQTDHIQTSYTRRIGRHVLIRAEWKL